jgi:hypothetical protein
VLYGTPRYVSEVRCREKAGCLSERGVIWERFLLKDVKCRARNPALVKRSKEGVRVDKSGSLPGCRATLAERS